MARIFVDFRNGFRVKLHLLGVVAFSYRLDDSVVLNTGVTTRIRFLWSVVLVAVESFCWILYFLHEI